MTDLKKLPKPQAVIFDWDNTLVDTWPIIHAALNSTFREYKLPEWTIETTRERVAKSLRDSFPDLFGERWEEAGARYQHHYRVNHLHTLAALPGAGELLAALREAGLKLSVVSNKKGPNLRKEIAHIGWEHYFGPAVVGSDDAPRDKPHPDPVLLALSKIGLTPGPDVWFVGDSEIDLAAAGATGCTPLLYGPHASEHPEYTPTHYRGHAYLRHALDHTALSRIFGEFR